MQITLSKRWRLNPMDGPNWQLQKLKRVTDKETGKASMKWVDVGRYYQASTFGNAIQYAADQEMKRKDGEAMALMDALAVWQGITDEMLRNVREA